MRVIEPHQFKAAEKRHKKTKRFRPISGFIIGLIFIGVLISIGVYVVIQVLPISEGGTTNQPRYTPPEDDPFSVIEKPLKDLSGEEFKQLYKSVVYPNTQILVSPPIITGNDEVDTRIRERAEARGYVLQSVPEAAIVRIGNEPRLGTDDLLQPLAADSWRKMREAARRAGYPVSLVSAYRSPNHQRELFVERLYQRVSLNELIAGEGEAAIDAVLEVTAVPGYSRHHTGYTIDLWCEDGSTAFVLSICHDWISEDNYKNAMEFGWIPSYPEGTEMQGPEPEPWEYVWVGDAVREQ